MQHQAIVPNAFTYGAVAYHQEGRIFATVDLA